MRTGSGQAARVQYLVNLILCLAGFDLLLLDVQIFVLYLILHAASLVQRTLGGIYVQLVRDQVFLNRQKRVSKIFSEARSGLPGPPLQELEDSQRPKHFCIQQ